MSSSGDYFDPCCRDSVDDFEICQPLDASDNDDAQKTSWVDTQRLAEQSTRGQLALERNLSSFLNKLGDAIFAIRLLSHQLIATALGGGHGVFGLCNLSLGTRALRRILCLIVLGLAITGTFSILDNISYALTSYPPDGLGWALLHWGRSGESTENLARWPTDATADTIPIHCHSHNDYWRSVPLYSAVAAGCSSVEADIWFAEGELYVGHRRSALTVERTLRNLYIDPLLSLLATQNVRPQIRPDEDYPLDPTEKFPANGIFDTDPGRSFVLLLDFKSAGPATWWQLQSQLLPLREMGYLTHFNGTGIQERPITVVATGNAPFDHLTANETYRDVFFDAPLEDLIDLSEWWPNPNWAQDPTRALDRQGRGQSKFLPRSRSSIQQASSHSKQQHCERRRSITSTGFTDDNYNRSNSLYASASFTKSVGRVWGSRLTQEQLQLIRGHVRGAHKLGLKVRYWDVPRWPVGLRNHIWHILAREGVDILNVDALLGVGRTDWRRARTRTPEWPKF